MTGSFTRCAVGLLCLVWLGAGGALAPTHAAGTDTIARLIAEHARTAPEGQWVPGKGGAPEVPGPYRRGFEKAWAMAGEGRAPSQICGGFFNGAGVRLANEATEPGDLRDSMLAMDACYTGVMARFLSAQLGKATDAKHSCLGEMTAMNTHRQVATSLLRDADPEGRLIAYLDGRLDAAIGDRVRTVCPDHVASIILPAPKG